ncbi:MAG TPA: hypothetical protein VK787_13660 [Puia sp.]|jgi:hypothetical protein|nr:hypothetical protein [Puia sp.]
MNNHIQLYQKIILNKDINSFIKKGMKGIILEILDNHAFAIEVSKEDGELFEHPMRSVFIFTEDDIEL